MRNACSLKLSGPGIGRIATPYYVALQDEITPAFDRNCCAGIAAGRILFEL
jgi:hypothetical protein